MRVGYSPEDEAFRQTLRDWFETHYPRFRAGWPTTPDPNALDWRRAWEDYVCQAGWSGLGWPLQYGGKAWPLTRQAIFHEEQARMGAPLGVNIIGHGILAPTLIHFASEAQALLVARLDNLGKGASGAAVQAMNVHLGVDEGLGLVAAAAAH